MSQSSPAPAMMYKPALTSNYAAVICEPFSTTLGVPICNAETPGFKGTGGLFLLTLPNPVKRVCSILTGGSINFLVMHLAVFGIQANIFPLPTDFQTPSPFRIPTSTHPFSTPPFYLSFFSTTSLFFFTFYPPRSTNLSSVRLGTG